MAKKKTKQAAADEHPRRIPQSPRQRIQLLNAIEAARDTTDDERRRQLEAWLINSRRPASPADKLRWSRLTPMQLQSEISRERQRLEDLISIFRQTPRDAEARELEKDAEVGKKVSEGGGKGTIKAHGTPEERATEYQQYQVAMNDLYATHPDWSQSRMLKKAAEQFACDPSTIKRHTSNPKKIK